LGANGPYFQWGRGFVLPNFEASKGNSHDFLMGEVRYASLVQSFPEEVKKLHAQLEEEYKERWEGYKKITGGVRSLLLTFPAKNSAGGPPNPPWSTRVSPRSALLTSLHPPIFPYVCFLHILRRYDCLGQIRGAWR
jgi:hypothetical protein